MACVACTASQTCNASGVCATPTAPACTSYESIKINNCTLAAWGGSRGAACYANNQNVTLNLNATGATQMRFKEVAAGVLCTNAGDTDWSTYENYAATKNFTVSAGDGDKKVCVELKNTVGSNKCGGTISLDTIKPTTPVPTIDSNCTGASRTVSWTASTDSGSGFASYCLFIDDTSNGWQGNNCNLTQYEGDYCACGILGTSYTPVNIQNGHAYSIWVIASDRAGNGSNNGSLAVNGLSLATLTVTKIGNGTVISDPTGISCGTDCTEDYTCGTSVTLTASPAPANYLSGWGGSCSGTTPNCALTMDVNKSASATFAATPDLSLTSLRVKFQGVYVPQSPFTGWIDYTRSKTVKIAIKTTGENSTLVAGPLVLETPLVDAAGGLFDGIFSGPVTISSLASGTYDVYIKGPSHLWKKFANKFLPQT
ncbi:MAG: hypothetical protein Q8N81_04175, partial [bacterium]|nr:hypothetical protein [bacterium]